MAEVTDEDLTEYVAEYIRSVTKFTSAAEVKRALRDKYGVETSANKVSAVLNDLYLEGLLLVRVRSRSGKGLTRFYSFFNREHADNGPGD